MKKILQIVILVSGAVFAASACALCGIYLGRFISRIKKAYGAVSDCFKPIDYTADEYED